MGEVEEEKEERVEGGGEWISTPRNEASSRG